MEDIAPLVVEFEVQGPTLNSLHAMMTTKVNQFFGTPVSPISSVLHDVSEIIKYDSELSPGWGFHEPPLLRGHVIASYSHEAIVKRLEQDNS